ncbi:MAG: hypothetical protein KBB54_00390 [Candidatus Pacebacteria bacterium]|nr:hypothetical protein [Candidatus Paceibacterota bacterium]MBP9818429.1 hypothetical protein [Candidatus Paceibacterota bacterium]
MTFLLCSYNHKINHQRTFGFIEAESPEEAAADPRVNSSILGTMGNGAQYILQRSEQEPQTQWFLEEIKPLTERPSEIDRKNP